jgi:type VI protein secretion system component Hcp
MRKIFYSLLVLPVLFFSVTVYAQGTQTFLKATATGFNFNGTSTQAGYENQNEISSFSNGIQSCAVSTKACASTFTGFSFTIQSNNAVTAFKAAQLQGKLITSVDLVMVKFSNEGPLEFYKIHMENVKVVNISEGASGEAPVISILLQPTKVAWKTTVQNNIGGAGASSSYGWDFAMNVPFNYAF